MKKRMNQHQKKQRGFTLVELLVYFGLFSILLVVINSLFITSLEQQTQDLARSALQQESEYILSRLKYDIYNADAVTLPADVGDQSQSLVLVKNGSSSAYALAGERLTITSGGETWFLTSSRVDVSNLQFQNQSGSDLSQTIGITVVINSDQEDDRASSTRTISTTVTRR